MKLMVKKVLSKSKNPVRRLLGFREWCEGVWEPSKRVREERLAALNRQASSWNKEQPLSP